MGRVWRFLTGSGTETEVISQVLETGTYFVRVRKPSVAEDASYRLGVRGAMQLNSHLSHPPMVRNWWR